VQQESMTLATISFQNYFRLYEKTGRYDRYGYDESEEFHQIYKLDTVEIPPNPVLARRTRQRPHYRSEKGKFNHRARGRSCRDKGQPMLSVRIDREKRGTESVAW